MEHLTQRFEWLRIFLTFEIWIWEAPRLLTYPMCAAQLRCVYRVVFFRVHACTLCPVLSKRLLYTYHREMYRGLWICRYIETVCLWVRLADAYVS